MKKHLVIIIAIVVGFTTFMLGYSLPPFLEVGFGGGENVGAGAVPDADLMKQYENLYKDTEE
ncbi:MAG: hypothetical protein P1P81_02995 [Desulfobulbales bacterium]|nr:hypothetical protein [Desulfobulbales bacterium]